MAALTNRAAARERLLKLFQAEVDRLIPQDPATPLHGARFREWEQQADEFDRTVTGALLEERAALADGATVSEGGVCPRCGSGQVYLEKQVARPTEVRTAHGTVVLLRQSCRCRSCGRSFSPSGSGLGAAPGSGGAVAQGRRAGGAGGGDPGLRTGGAGA